MNLPLTESRVLPDLISFEPATGAELWRGPVSDVDHGGCCSARRLGRNGRQRRFPTGSNGFAVFPTASVPTIEKFADLIARETGKPLWEARTEVESVVNKVDISVKAYAERTSQRRLEGKTGSRSAFRHKPHGVLAVLGPYNFPAHLPNGHIVPALIAGNAVVFKPSEKTPASGAMLVDYYHKAGIPEGVVRIAQGGPETGKALSMHPDIDGLLFTGSAQTGIALNRQFAHRPDKILALEMGGNNPIIVWDTRDIHSAAVLVVQSAFLSAGQRCTAARRLIVKDDMFDPVVSEVKKIADRLVIGEPHGEPPAIHGAGYRQ